MRKFFLALGLLFTAVPAFADTDVGPYQVTYFQTRSDNCSFVQVNAAGTYYAVDPADAGHDEMTAQLMTAAFSGQTVVVTWNGTSSTCSSLDKIIRIGVGTIH